LRFWLAITASFIIIRVSAAGHSALQVMPNLAVSLAIERVSPMMPAFAAAVVALPHRALERVRREIDDPPVALPAHVLDGVVRHRPVALQVHVDHRVEIVFRHVPDHLLAQHAGDVDEDVDLAERVDALGDHASGLLVVGDAVVVGDGGAAGRLDLIDDIVGGSLFGRLAAAPTPGSLTMTLAPSRASSKATSRPMPRPAPVTMADFPSRCIRLSPWVFDPDSSRRPARNDPP
jgi:hypothetical protein